MKMFTIAELFKLARKYCRERDRVEWEEYDFLMGFLDYLLEILEKGENAFS